MKTGAAWVARGLGLLTAALGVALLQAEAGLLPAQSPGHTIIEATFGVAAIAGVALAWYRPIPGALLLLAASLAWFVYLPVGAGEWGIESGVARLGLWAFGLAAPVTASLFWYAALARRARPTFSQRVLRLWPAGMAVVLAALAVRFGLLR